MGFSMDAQVREALEPLLAAARAVTPPPAGDWHTRRVIIERTLEMAARALSPVNGIRVDGYATTALDGTRVPLFLYSRTDTDLPGSAALFLHGGGMIMGWHRIYDVLARHMSPHRASRCCPSTTAWRPSIQISFQSRTATRHWFGSPTTQPVLVSTRRASQ